MTDEELLCENVAKEFWAKHLNDEEYQAWLTARKIDNAVYSVLCIVGKENLPSLHDIPDTALKILAKLVNDEVWRRVK